MSAEPTILATSGGFRSTGRGLFDAVPGPIIDFALQLSGAIRPRICFVGTATGDSPVLLQVFYGAFAGREDAIPSHLALFTMPNVADPAAHLLAQDVIWVGGGSVANLLAVWRAHGLEEVFREAWQRGIVLAGVSAGSLCWHVGGTTDSFGRDLRPVTNGLGFLPYANGVHYDSEEQRRPLLHRLVGDGTLPTAYATDDGVGLLYRGTEMVEAVADRHDVAAYLVEQVAPGEVNETRIQPRLLPGAE
jgi:peptidase E